MVLTEEVYYDTKINRDFMSVSQFKSFSRCEAATMAELNGEYTPERGRALLLGSYLDEMLTGTKESQEKFVEENRAELFKKNGEPYADVAQADEAVSRVKAQPLMVKYLSGEHQVILTGEIGGVPVKGKFDSYQPGEFVADLKYLKDFKSPNLFENAISYYGYDTQLAVYRELIRQNTGDVLPAYLVIVTKQNPPDVAVVEIDSFDLDEKLEEFKKQTVRFQAIKDGKVEPERCESHDCPYCRQTRVLSEPIDSALLGMSEKKLKAMRGEG
jgi:hypothetical protein